MAVDFKQNRRAARLRAGLRELTNSGFARIHSEAVSVAGHSKVSLRERVTHYTQHAKAAGAKFYPELRPNLSDRKTKGLASKINSGLTLIEIAQKSDPLVRPLLFYYGVSQVCGAACDAFLKWNGATPSHGMRVDYDRSLLRFDGYGTFQRLATTLFVLNRDANPFVEFMFTHDNPADASRVNGPSELAFDELLKLRADVQGIEAWISGFQHSSNITAQLTETRSVGITRQVHQHHRGGTSGRT